MKVVLKDGDSKDFDVGYQRVYDDESGSDISVFYIETSEETVSLKMSRKNLGQLSATIQFLMANS